MYFFLPCVSPEVSCYERKHIVSSLFPLPFKYLKDTKGSPFEGGRGILCFSLYPISIDKFWFEQQETAVFSVFFLNFSWFFVVLKCSPEPSQQCRWGETHFLVLIKVTHFLFLGLFSLLADHISCQLPISLSCWSYFLTNCQQSPFSLSWDLLNSRLRQKSFGVLITVILGWFLFSKNSETPFVHVPKLFPLLHWFQNTFCFLCSSTPSHGGRFFSASMGISMGKWPK